MIFTLPALWCCLTVVSAVISENPVVCDGTAPVALTMASTVAHGYLWGDDSLSDRRKHSVYTTGAEDIAEIAYAAISRVCSPLPPDIGFALNDR
jgi:hypothetical protein